MDNDTTPLARLISAGDALAAFTLEIAQEMEAASGDVMDGAECRALAAEWAEAVEWADARAILEVQGQLTHPEVAP